MTDETNFINDAKKTRETVLNAKKSLNEEYRAHGEETKLLAQIIQGVAFEEEDINIIISSIAEYAEGRMDLGQLKSKFRVHKISMKDLLERTGLILKQIDELRKMEVRSEHLIAILEKRVATLPKIISHLQSFAERNKL